MSGRLKRPVELRWLRRNTRAAEVTQRIPAPSAAGQTVDGKSAMSLSLLLSLLLCGCNSRTSQPTTLTANPEAAHTETERGPVKVSVDVVPKEPRLSDEPTLTLTVNAKDGVDVEMPPFGESLGAFIIRDFHEPIPATAEGNQILQRDDFFGAALLGSEIGFDCFYLQFGD